MSHCRCFLGSLSLGGKVRKSHLKDAKTQSLKEESIQVWISAPSAIPASAGALINPPRQTGSF
jgi:hypothetical protein